MKILQMRASFGRLKDAELTLGPGLNIVQAPNESGKSTWCAFIRAMLYGIRTSDRDKAGSLSDKTRYRPWDGGAMEGEMTLEHDGQRVTLTRTAAGGSPMKKLTAVYTGTGMAVPALEGDGVGETLTGMPEKVFERTAFIRQAGLRVSGDPELEKRIAALVSTGDEQVSFSQADALLRKWDRSVEYKKSGRLPKLRAELEENEALLGRLQTLAVTSARAAEQTGNFEKRVACFAQQLHQLDGYEAYIRDKRAVQAADAADAAREKEETLRGQLMAGTHEVTRPEIAALRAAYSAAVTRKSTKNEAAETERETRAALEETSARRDASPFAPLPPEDALRRAAAAVQAEETLHRPVWRFVLLLLAAAAAAGAVIAAQPVFYAIGAAAAIGCVAGFAAAGAGYRKNTARLKKLLGGCPSAEVLDDTARRYAADCAAAETAAGVHATAAAALHQAEAALQLAMTQLKQAVSVACPGARPGEIQEILTRLDAAADGLTQARQEAAAALARSQALGGRPAEPAPFAEKPDVDRAVTERNLRDAQARLSQAQQNMNLLQGELRACGDPILIGTRIEQLREEISGLEERHAALELAEETLCQADTEMQTRFSPVLSREAGAIMAELTGGRYTRLAFDKDFDAQAAGETDAAAHSALYLSSGTLDQLYLALRLALCELMLDGEEPCPIFLDDALLAFDDERFSRAMELLWELSRRRQVILFTCQGRERRWLRRRKGEKGGK